MSRYDHIGKTHTVVSEPRKGTFTVFYHDTAVVSMIDNVITLRNSLWYTSTTKTRMNQTAMVKKLPYWVYQEKEIWYVRLRFDEKIQDVPFTNGMKIILDKNNSVKEVQE